MRGLEIVTGFTLAALALYFFVGQGNQSSQFINSLATGYKGVVTSLQGR